MQIKRLRVGVVGAGEVAQTTHVGVKFLFLYLHANIKLFEAAKIQLYSAKFEATAICDVNSQSLKHCAEKLNIPHIYMDV